MILPGSGKKFRIRPDPDPQHCLRRCLKMCLLCYLKSHYLIIDRDEALMAKKEERMKKVLEEERAAREFHANPVPKGLSHE